MRYLKITFWASFFGVCTTPYKLGGQTLSGKAKWVNRWFIDLEEFPEKADKKLLQVKSISLDVFIALSENSNNVPRGFGGLLENAVYLDLYSWTQNKIASYGEQRLEDLSVNSSDAVLDESSEFNSEITAAPRFLASFAVEKEEE
ncbi:hypothetical protein KM043_018479 [Ampulex compressa]|nr:hypothetical protein KM043_018479 [Ampulex compressa]